MKEMKNIPASVHARLQNKAKNQNKLFQEILQYYGMERFLFRLSQTQYGRMFIIKGGLFFYARGYSLRRPTRDIDFCVYIENSAEDLVEIIKKAISIPATYDGLYFKNDSVHIEEIMVDADYPGYRIIFDALLGSSVIPLQIDVGFSNVIFPEAKEIKYPVLLEEMEAPVFKIYPPEMIISEKFQAMVRLADINSRWKDYYDIWMLSELQDINGEILQNAISVTCQQRKTHIPEEIPIGLSDNFATVNQRNWERFLSRNLMSQDSIQSFSEIIGRLRLFLLPPVRAIVEKKPFQLYWKAGSNWF
ncbi:MAG: nucleotidyl transferase AbiEii/AbiGii toxin family protein [Anaerolineaceae bacterium]